MSIEQVHHADMELFKVLMKETRAGIRASGGVAPLEVSLAKALVAPEIRLHLQPLQGSSGSAGKRKLDDELHETTKKKDTNSSDSDKLRRQIENLQGQLKNIKKGKGKGKGKSSKSSSSVKMPAELLGQSAMNADGEPICFSFNCGGCSKAGAGLRCPKGWHVCTKWGCYQPHSQRDHKGA